MSLIGKTGVFSSLNSIIPKPITGEIIDKYIGTYKTKSYSRSDPPVHISADFYAVKNSDGDVVHISCDRLIEIKYYEE